MNINKSQRTETLESDENLNKLTKISIPQQLQKQLSSSQRHLNQSQARRIQQILRSCQTKVYGFETSNQDIYLQSFINRHPLTLAAQIEELVFQKTNILLKELEKGELIIPERIPISSKSMQKTSQEKSNKRIDTNFEQSFGIQQSQSGSTLSKGHSTDLPGIRSFLKSIQQKQRTVKTRLERSYQLEKQIKQRSFKHEQQIKQLKQAQRVRQYKEKQLERRKRKEIQKSEFVAKEQQFKQFVGKLRRHPKPLFELKSDQFNELQAKEKQDLRKKVHSIKERNKPVDGDDLRNHQKQYQKKRNMLELQRIDKMERIIAERDIPTPSQLFKGQFYSSQQPQKDPSYFRQQRSRSVRERINHFNDIIRQNFKPKIDEKKRQQLQNFIDFQKKRQKIKSSLSTYEEKSKQQDSKTLGNKYLSELKRLTPQIRKTYKPQTSQSNASKMTGFENQRSMQIRQYLHSGAKGLKQNLGSWKKDLISEQLSSEQKYQLVLDKVQKLNVQAKRKEKQLKTENKSTEKAFQLKQSIDNYYINSIQAKLQLMSRLGK